MLSRLFRPRSNAAKDRVADRGALTARVAGFAAFVANKCAHDYCQVKLGYDAERVFATPEFAEVFAICRWESMASLAADFLVMTEGLLRPHVAAERLPDLAAALAALHPATIALHGAPPHRPDGWPEAVEWLTRRIARAQLAPPAPPDAVARESGALLHATLPVHPDLMRPDKLPVVNAVRFQAIGRHDALAAALDRPALAADLLAS